MKRYIPVFASAAITAAFLILPSFAFAAIISVPSGQPTIQAAVNAAAAGDTIIVAAGTYTEQVLVNKKLRINGANAGISVGATPGTRGIESIVDGGFYIQTAADGTVVDGFTVEHGYVDGGHNDGFTVEPSGTPGVTIQNNIIETVTTPDQSNGIETGYAANNLTIKDNSIKNNYRGIYLNPSDSVTITGNVIDSNNGSGVGIGSDGQSNF
ncbi:MAG TPA: right-handed parallel beta-helix repeat-containing protein, partial [Candidatus Paceibacterota bacterium]